MFYFLKVNTDSPEPNNDEKGRLFERLVCDIVEGCGYTIDVLERAKKNSLEYDIIATHPLTGTKLIGEAKAHTGAIRGQTLNAFVGKMTPEWLDDQRTLGLFISTSPLTSDAVDWFQNKWLPVSKRLGVLKVIAEEGIFEVLRTNLSCLEPKQVQEIARAETGFLPSETYFVTTEHTSFFAQTLMEPTKGVPTHFCVIDLRGRRIDNPILYGALRSAVPPLKGLQPVDSSQPDQPKWTAPELARVPIRDMGNGWFDYKFPAPPKYFIGRNEDRAFISRFIQRVGEKAIRERVFQVKSRSGVGKSSLLLKVADEVTQQGHSAIVIDSRNLRSGLDILHSCFEFLSPLNIQNPTRPTTKRELYEWLREVCRDLELIGRVAMICFDQFESLFDRPECYTYFLDVAQEVTSACSNIVLVLARKNDQFAIVDQAHEIDLHLLESISLHTELREFTKEDTHELLSRLGQEMGGILQQDLKQQILEFAGGFPWLLKRVCRHVLDLWSRGYTQTELAQAGLKLEDLFEAELAVLEQPDREFLERLIQVLPKTTDELRDMFGAVEWARLERLQRLYLIRLSGRTFDTYNDVLKEYIRFGRTPVNLRFAFKQSPKSTLALLKRILDLGLYSVNELVDRARIQQGTILNRCRELRMLGLIDYDKDKITVRDITVEAYKEGHLDDLIKSQVKANGIVREVTRQLFSQFPLPRACLVKLMQDQLPFLDASPETWRVYALNLASWMHHFGLAQYQNDALYPPDVKIISSKVVQADGLRLPASYIKGLLRFAELFRREESLAKSVASVRLGRQKLDDILHDAVFLSLVHVDRETLRLTEAGRVFLDAPRKRRAKYVRTHLSELPFVRTYLELLGERGYADHQTIFAETLKRHASVQWTWSTTDWRAKVLVNWLVYADMLSRKAGEVSARQQLRLDID